MSGSAYDLSVILRADNDDVLPQNGYTTDAQQTYANATQRDDHRIALVTMRGTNRRPARSRTRGN